LHDTAQKAVLHWLLGITFAGLVSSVRCAYQLFFVESHQQAEEKHTRQAVAGVSSSFIQTQDFNYCFADWSMCQFTPLLKDVNEDIEENLHPRSLDNFDVNSMLFYPASWTVGLWYRC